MNPGGDSSVNPHSVRFVQTLGDRDRTHIQETVGHARPSMPGLTRIVDINTESEPYEPG